MNVRNTAVFLSTCFITLFALQSNAPAADSLLAKTTTWLANSYGGICNGVPAKKNHSFGNLRGTVPTRMRAMAVAGNNGWVYTKSLVEEAHKQFAVFDNNGIDMGNMGAANGQWSGYNFSTGHAIGVNDKYVVLEARHKEYGWGWLRRFSRTDHLPLHADWQASEGPVAGIALTEDRLIVSTPNEDLVRLYDLSASEIPAEIRSIHCAAPGGVCIDARKRVWVALPEEDAIIVYSLSGEELNLKIRVPDHAQIEEIAFDHSAGAPWSGLLLVADNGRDKVVRFYDPDDALPNPIGQTPEAMSAFGTAGGIYSGVRGQWHPKKLWGLRDVATDSSGNLFILQNEDDHQFGCVLSKFSPSGELLWQRMSLATMDNGINDPAPATEDEVYTQYYRIRVNLAANGTTLPHERFTVLGRTLDTERYPDDPRSHDEFYRANKQSLPVSIRRINGRRVLFLSGMFGQYLAIYRFSPETDGEIAIPCGLFITKKSKTWPENQPDMNGWFWIDDNGNGAIETEEYRTDSAARQLWKFPTVDSDHAVWFTNDTSIVRLRMTGMNTHGVPHYSFAEETSEQWPIPKPMTEVTRVLYQPDRDMLVLGGLTANTVDAFADQAGVGWKGGFLAIARYPQWLEGNRRAADPVIEGGVLVAFDGKPDKRHGNHSIMGLDWAGDYLFAQHSSTIDSSGSHHIGHHRLDIFDVRDGSHTGYMVEMPHASAGIAQIDHAYGMRASRRGNGEYLVFLEDNWFGKILLHQWQAQETTTIQNRRKLHHEVRSAERVSARITAEAIYVHKAHMLGNSVGASLYDLHGRLIHRWLLDNVKSRQTLPFRLSSHSCAMLELDGADRTVLLKTLALN